MRFIHLYLLGYFLLVVGAGLTLWQAGAFSRLGPFWAVTGTILAVGLGVLLALTSHKRPMTQE